MRHVMFTACLALATLGAGAGLASATPFEPATIPDQIQAVGHLDVDALRKTQIFQAAGGQAMIDAALDDAPSEFRALARSLTRTIRGVSFWREGEHGALHVETRDARALAQLVGKLPARPAQAIDGYPTYVMEAGARSHHIAVFGDTLVLAETADSLEHAVHVLAGKAASLAGSNKLPIVSRQGVFVFVTVGDDLLGAIQKSAHSKVLQLGLRSLVVDVGETAGTVTASARAEMRSADALQKGKSILEGLRAMASLSDDPGARTLLDGVTVTTNGLALEVVAKLSVGDIAKAIHTAKRAGHHHQE